MHAHHHSYSALELETQALKWNGPKEVITWLPGWHVLPHLAIACIGQRVSGIARPRNVVGLGQPREMQPSTIPINCCLITSSIESICNATPTQDSLEHLDHFVPLSSLYILRGKGLSDFTGNFFSSMQAPRGISTAIIQ